MSEKQEATNKDENFSWSFVWRPLFLVLFITAIYTFDNHYQLKLYEYGIFPRSLEGLIGLVTAPFIHGDAEHLRNNMLPLLVLLSGLYYFYPRKASPVVLISWLGSGLMVWFFARESFHIGASGLIYALAAFIFFSGILRGQVNLLALSLLVVFLYGSMVWGLVPMENGVSYEAHLAGGIWGLLLAFYFRTSPPRDLPKTMTIEDVNDDLSEQIERFGPDYWEQRNTAEGNAPMYVNYHLKKNSNEKQGNKD